MTVLVYIAVVPKAEEVENALAQRWGIAVATAHISHARLVARGAILNSSRMSK